MSNSTQGISPNINVDNSQTPLSLSNELIREFFVAKTFRENTGRVNSVTFSTDGSFVATSGDDDIINVYDCNRGTHLRTCRSKKYGCDLATYTHNPSTLLYASKKLGNHDLRYLSLHDNKFIRYFTGHTDRVTNLKLNPTSDVFLTTSLDKTMRLWDIRSPNCLGVLGPLTSSKKVLASFDPEGLVFAVSGTPGVVKLFDMRKYTQGPFTKFLLPPSNSKPESNWTSLNFNPSGLQLAINTDGQFIYVIDGFFGTAQFKLGGRLCTRGKCAMCFTPDGKYILSTSEDGTILVWDCEAESGGRLVAVLNPQNPAAVGVVSFNPKLLMLVSAGAGDTALWLKKE